MTDGPLTTADEYRRAYREVLDEVPALVTPLDDAALAGPVGCPGWTVHDCVAHVTDVETILLRRERPAHQAPAFGYVRSDFTAFLENGVDYRRGWTREQLLSEYREVTAERLRMLDAMSDADLDVEGPGIFGTAPLKATLGIRIFDIWSHAQDIRRATQQPGGFDTLAARNARNRMMRGIAATLSSSGIAHDGDTVRIVFTEPVHFDRTIVFDGGRGRVVDSADNGATVTLRADAGTLTVLCCGRCDDPGANERVMLEGDEALGDAIVAGLAFTP